MRIVGGKFRGRKLTPVGKGDLESHLRPTTDRVRENLFNIISGGRFGDIISDARVLDLFAGTGAMGIEAISRGASHVTFVDNGKTALGLIRKNIELLDLGANATVLQGSADRLEPNKQTAFDLVFLDPPYGKNLGVKALQSAQQQGWLAPDAVTILEEGAAVEPPNGFEVLDRRSYGGTHILILQTGDSQ